MTLELLHVLVEAAHALAETDVQRHNPVVPHALEVPADPLSG